MIIDTGSLNIIVIIFISIFMIFFQFFLVILNNSSVYAEDLLPMVKDPDLVIEQIGKGLPDSPTGIGFLDNDNFLVTVKTGAVYLVSNDTLHQEPVLNLTVDTTLERGLLGIAISKDNSTINGAVSDPKISDDKSKTTNVFLYLTELDELQQPKNMIYRFYWNGIKLINPTIVMELPALPGPLHNSGKLAFGPDNYLYIIIGDLIRSGLLQNIKNSSLPDDTSVVLRVDPEDGSPAENNPFIDNKTLNNVGPTAKYFGYGIRNSFGEAFDPVTGQLWITENGPHNYDEINLVRPGFNGGWKILNGPIIRSDVIYNDLVNLPGSMYSDPVFSWRKAIAVTGLDFSSSVLGKQYANDLFVGDFNYGNLYHFVVNKDRNGFDFENKTGLSDSVADNDKELSYSVFGMGFGNITEVKTGPDGFLYILDFLYDRIFCIMPKE